MCLKLGYLILRIIPVLKLVLFLYFKILLVSKNICGCLIWGFITLKAVTVTIKNCLVFTFYSYL